MYDSTCSFKTIIKVLTEKHMCAIIILYNYHDHNLICLFITILTMLTDKRMCAIIILYKDVHAYFDKTLLSVLSAH